MFLILLLCIVTQVAGHQRIGGRRNNDSCVCEVNTTLWTFPTVRYEVVTQVLQSCENSLQQLQTQVKETNYVLPKMEAVLENLTTRLQGFQYLNTQGLYNSLNLKQLSQELQHLHQTISSAHVEQPGFVTENLLAEVQKAQEDVEKMYKENVFNMETVREKLRSLSNRAQSCRSIPEDFRSTCSQRILTNISAPVVTKLNPFSESYISGSWGRDTSMDAEEIYWIQPLDSGHRFGNILRFHTSHEEFMSGRNYKDEAVASSNTDSDAIQGPGSIMYDGVLYYQCYNVPELCAFNLKTKQVQRLEIPEAGVNNKFPYCYYNCHDWTDIDLAADKTGLWVIYATNDNHGNVVLSRVDWEGFNVTHTWKTRLFKRSVTNAFIVCGVLYATRYVDTFKEEVFYAFDTTTGTEDNTLSLPLEKVSAGIANLHYNPTDQKLYMYNGGYLLAYQTFF